MAAVTMANLLKIEDYEHALRHQNAKFPLLIVETVSEEKKFTRYKENLVKLRSRECY